MKRYLPQMACALCLLLGVSVGWYFGYTRPAIQMHRVDEEIEMESGMSHEDVVKAVPEAFAALKREDESTALVSLKAIGMLDRGDVGRAKKYLAYWVGTYYRVYHDKSGDTNLLKEIEGAASTNTVLAREISRKVGQ